MSWLDEREVTEKQIANSNFSYVSYYENDNIRTDLLAIIHNNKLYTVTFAMGNQDKNYNNCMDGYNYMMDKIYI